MKKNKHATGQITVDFMVAVGMALLFFILLVNAAYTNQRQARELEVKYSAEKVLERLSSNINAMVVCGGNCSTTMTLPETLEYGVGYTLTVHPRSVLLNYTGHHYSRGILTAETGGVVGVNPGAIRITNDGGHIRVENE
jgi:hypothetical protein